jgi:hypothetical protein
MDLLQLKANALLAMTLTVKNAAETLTTVMNVLLLTHSSILNAFLIAQVEPTFQMEDAENVTPSARNAQATKTVLDVSLNSTLTMEDARHLALTEKCSLKANVSPALIQTARTA